MTDLNIWNEIKSIRKKIGMSDTNFRKIKSSGSLPEKWVAPIYLALKGKKKKAKISIEDILGLANQ